MAEREPAAALPRHSEAQAPVQPGLGIRVVGIGASAGGLEACRLFLGGLPAAPGMAFILVQHLDPTHDSMMAPLLAGATAMQVVEARDGMAVELDHLYLIPPGLYLAIANGRLNLSAPLARHGARLPFDFLLHALAAAAGSMAACVILSGGGADGSIGARAIAAAGGLVIAQDPAEATHPSMPESAIATGVVDLVLPAADIGAALLNFLSGPGHAHPAPGTLEIIALLKSLTAYDFTLYKTGTMDRRIARRMSIAGFGAGETARYMERLRHEEAERRELVNDLLINVTNFFRDPKVFELLAASTIPDLIAAGDGAIRLWVAGCSTGEETYSLTMLLLEGIDASGTLVMPQIFATDIDAQAVMRAREGLYPVAIEKDVTPARLARFFTRDEHGYRVSTALRACVVFAVQDVLSDPPFSKLNMVSCRNLLIYLRPEAQAKIIAVFNFALRPGGFLLLGAAETVSAPDQRFEQISKAARLYRKRPQAEAGRPPTGEPPLDFLRQPRLPPAVTQQAAEVGEACRKLLLEGYAPAAALVNARLECLYTFGPTDAFLRAASGPATHDLLAQLPASLRTRVRDGVVRAAAGEIVRVGGGRITRDGNTRRFQVEIRALPGHEGKFLVCLLDQPEREPAVLMPISASHGAGIAALETELAETRAELLQAVQALASAAEAHNAINEEALSVNEEFQSTNEELLTSKEELQSLNEELTALNSQLQESLERSRMTSTDLRNVLYSTDVPTLFLDDKLNIRFFTPSVTALFHIIPGDVGRKLEDFRSLAEDPELLADAARVLATGAALEFEMRTADGTCYLRRIQAYRTYEGAVAGVVITFTDTTLRRAAAVALEVARHEADRANLAKSRFLAAASHDLRQPLQSMSLINGMLAKTATDPASQALIARLDNTMQSITTMLDAMLDINQIEAGVIRANVITVEVGVLLTGLYEKFKEQAASQHTELRVVPCSLSIATDPGLLEQMLNNLVGNALKYTKAGRVLVGVRRAGPMLRIEVWDSGIGIAADQLKNIFEEYHQINNPVRDRSRGLGLGLSIVHRLGHLLGHNVTVSSTQGKGSTFAVEIPRVPVPALIAPLAPAPQPAALPQGVCVLVIEDDPDIGQLLTTFLIGEGCRVLLATDGAAASALVANGGVGPEIILADYNLPGQQTGLAVAHALRAALRWPIPVIIMTGDISSNTLRLIADGDCVQINKPMKLETLMSTLRRLLTDPARRVAATTAPLPAANGRGIIYVVDDDPEICSTMRTIFEEAGKQVQDYPDAESFLAAMPRELDDCCLLIDAALPGMSGLQSLQKFTAQHATLPAIIVTGIGDIGMAVQAMKAGAADFLEKPVQAGELLDIVRRVLDDNLGNQAVGTRQRDALRQIEGLTARQREVMDRVLAGQPSKNIAADLGISQRTVENHRASIMLKTGAKSVPALARLAILAARS
jgi:two-component system CheB/CheR fusion protein